MPELDTSLLFNNITTWMMIFVLGYIVKTLLKVDKNQSSMLVKVKANEKRLDRAEDQIDNLRDSER